MRLCPSVEGSASPLITHRIGVDVCLARQRTFFHKCHRCIYRGQAANWEPADAPLAMLDMHAPEEPGNGEVKLADMKTLEIARPAPEPKAAKTGKPSKPGKKSTKALPKTVDASI